MDPNISSTCFGEANRRLSDLSQAIEQDETAKNQLLETLVFATKDWGHNSVPKELDTTGWISNFIYDRSPFEYSVQLDRNTGDAQLYFLIEARSEEDSLVRFQESARRLDSDTVAKYNSRVSLDHYKLIQDLFIPDQPNGVFAAWHSFASTKKGLEWKIYLNPSASGKDNILSTTGEAFGRLGLGNAWVVVKSIMTPGDSIISFSLDLSSNQEEARAEVYMLHQDTTASQIANKHTCICPDATWLETERFCMTMANGSHDLYSSTPVVSSFAFTSKRPNQAVGTIHFPIHCYAENDADAQERIERYLDEVSASPVCKERYKKVVNAVWRRPLDQGRGIHAWVSLKQDLGYKQLITFYISPELFGPLQGTYRGTG
ncbi:Aromatic prenyltransferase, DMATS type [Daldinia childiae]|uniref:Aromatic prenyltransferase, DMATS type n=1 Tax=Daldinia childiae TaxID=326645 RepID=UPI001446503C|nr:Aromatic prenyltransferase, DMATS type [Daldinia childiae]KAF3059987.1 Aromatic prenyltransferase, DMATS type [Daldinia childiae]